jgi:hypothetical protein
MESTANNALEHTSLNCQKIRKGLAIQKLRTNYSGAFRPKISGMHQLWDAGLRGALCESIPMATTATQRCHCRL